MTASTTHAAPSCGECVCPRQAALPHWLRLNASLSLGDVAAEPGLSYQWVKDGFQIAGATNSFFHIRNATHEHAGVYECIVRNATALTSRVIPTILRVGRKFLFWGLFIVLLFCFPLFGGVVCMRCCLCSCSRLAAMSCRTSTCQTSHDHAKPSSRSDFGLRH